MSKGERRRRRRRRERERERGGGGEQKSETDVNFYLSLLHVHADIPQAYEETVGIQTNIVYWPVKVYKN